MKKNSGPFVVPKNEMLRVLYNMDFFDKHGPLGFKDWIITRVFGGWIFRHLHSKDSGNFILFNDEFKKT